MEPYLGMMFSYE